MTQTPRTFSHIGLSVPALDAAVKFYSDVLGFYVVMGPSEAVEDDSAIGVMCTDVFGSGWGSLRIAHMSTADGIGIELFEFPGNYAPEDKLEHKRHGTFHFAVQDPDVEGLAQRIVEAGGRQRMPVREYFPGKKPYRMVYVEDPFGIVFELYSHSYELTYSAGAYEQFSTYEMGRTLPIPQRDHNKQVWAIDEADDPARSTGTGLLTASAAVNLDVSASASQFVRRSSR